MLQFEVWIAKFHRKLPENVEIFYMFDHFCHFCQSDMFDTKNTMLETLLAVILRFTLAGVNGSAFVLHASFGTKRLKVEIVTLPSAHLSFIGFHRENYLFCSRWNILAPWCWNHVNIICFWQRLLNGTSISFLRSQRPLRFAHSPTRKQNSFLKERFVEAGSGTTLKQLSWVSSLVQWRNYLRMRSSRHNFETSAGWLTCFKPSDIYGEALITEEELHGVFAELQNWGDCVWDLRTVSL